LLRAARIAIVEKEHRGDSNIDQTGWKWEIIEHCDLFQSLLVSVSFLSKKQKHVISSTRDILYYCFKQTTFNGILSWEMVFHKEHYPMAHDAEITAKHLDDYPFQQGI